MGDRADRSARDVLSSHLKLRHANELDRDLEENYHPDVVMMSAKGVFKGHDGIRETAQHLADAIPDPGDYVYDHIVVDDRMALLEWRARSDSIRVSCGVDAYLIEDGLITAQTIHYRAENTELSVSADSMSAPGSTGPSMHGDGDDTEGLITLAELGLDGPGGAGDADD